MADRPYVQTFTQLGDALTNAMSDANRPLPMNGGTARTLFSLAENKVRVRLSIVQAGPADIERAVEGARQDFEKGLALCESPIECMTLAALMTADWWSFGAIVPRIHDARHGRELPQGNLVIIPQMNFARVRMDFAVLARSRRDGLKFICVECDGGAFHDPVADRKRDSYLASWDIPTFRISGSNIHADVAQALQPAVDSLIEWYADGRKRSAA